MINKPTVLLTTLALAGSVLLSGAVTSPSAAGGCGQTPTTTKIKPASSTAVYGAMPPLVVKVLSDGGTPTGSVAVTFDGDGVAHPLTDGRYRTNLPLMEHVDRAYGITAWYEPDCQWSASDASGDFTLT